MKDIFKPPWSKGMNLDEPAGPIEPNSFPEQIVISRAPLLEIVNKLWRIKTTVNIHGNDELKEFNLIKRNVESALDSFNDAGFKVIDHTDEKVPEGGHLTWKVISYQENKSVSAEVVAETVKPSIYIGAEQVQRGEVIVATPVAMQQEEQN